LQTSFTEGVGAEDWRKARYLRRTERVVTQGAGAKASNQRGYRCNLVARQATGTFRVSFNEQFVDTKRLRALLEYAGEHVGIGASRKMGMGRFHVTGFDKA